MDYSMIDYAAINPDYQNLRFLLVISGAVITMLLAVVAYFLKRQILVSELLTLAVNNLNTTVKLIEQKQEERDPRTEKRLNEHAEQIKRHERKLAVLEIRCNMHHKEREVKNEKDGKSNS